MEILNVINKIKENLLNILIIIVALMISFNNYKTRNKALEILKAKRDVELKINQLLDEISTLENMNFSLKGKINNKAVSATIDVLGGIARDSNVKIILIKPQVERFYSAYTLYPFEVSITSSSYHRVAKFINLLEKSSNIYFIENMELSSNPQIKEDKITAKLVISTILINN
jgi:Tfp pilus assembly protein PilO